MKHHWGKTGMASVKTSGLGAEERVRLGSSWVQHDKCSLCWWLWATGQQVKPYIAYATHPNMNSGFCRLTAMFCLDRSDKSPFMVTFCYQDGLRHQTLAHLLLSTTVWAPDSSHIWPPKFPRHLSTHLSRQRGAPRDLCRSSHWPNQQCPSPRGTQSGMKATGCPAIAIVVTSRFSRRA